MTTSEWVATMSCERCRAATVRSSVIDGVLQDHVEVCIRLVQEQY